MLQAPKAVDKVISIKPSRENGLDHISPINLEGDTINPFTYFSKAKGLFPSGFHEHPHKNVEAITYVLDGTLNHEDAMGGSHALHAGSTLYIDAGKGFSHIQIPASEEEITEWITVFIFLPESKRGGENKTVLVPKNNVIAKENRLTVKVLCGAYDKLNADLISKTGLFAYDVNMKTKAKFCYNFPVENTVVALVIQGTVFLSEDKIQAVENDFVVFKNDGHGKVVIETEDEEARLIILSAECVDCDIVKDGLFVGSAKEENDKTKHECESKKGVFSKYWKSDCGRLLLNKGTEMCLPH